MSNIRNIAVQMRQVLGNPEGKIILMTVTNRENGVITLVNGRRSISVSGGHAVGSRVLVSNGNIVGSASQSELTIWAD